jgi:hypothetical protein
MNSSTMAAHSYDGGIQWLRVKPWIWMCSIVRFAPRRTAELPWQSKSPAIAFIFVIANFVATQNSS